MMVARRMENGVWVQTDVDSMGKLPGDIWPCPECVRTVPARYLKTVDGQPVEMTTDEKAAVDTQAATEAAQAAANRQLNKPVNLKLAENDLFRVLRRASSGLPQIAAIVASDVSALSQQQADALSMTISGLERAAPDNMNIMGLRSKLADIRVEVERLGGSLADAQWHPEVEP